MFINDRKVAKAILELTNKDYAVEVYFDEGESKVECYTGENNQKLFVDIPLKSQEIFMSINRLIESGYLKPDLDTLSFGVSFYITDKLTHRFAFFLEEVKQRFVFGFIAGLASGIASMLIVLFSTGHL